MKPKSSGITTLVAIIYAWAFLPSIVSAQQPETEPRYKPRYTLWAFTATGADSNDYDINDYDAPDNDYNDGNPDNDFAIIYIRNVKNKKKVCELSTPSNGLVGFELRIAPDKKHALLFYSRSKMYQICWLHLPDGKPPANWIEEDKLENLALTACGKVDSGWVAKHKFWFLVDFLDWDAQGRCRLKWEYSVSHEGSDDTTNTGIAIVTEGRNGEPSVSIDSFLKDLTDDQMKNVRYGKHVTLKK